MEHLKKTFIRFLIERGALKFGTFKLKSGKVSPFFINIGQISTGEDLEFLGDCLAETLKSGFPDVTSLFGPAYKGITLATVIATSFWRKYQKSLAVFYDRKEAKDHGEGGLYIGGKPSPEDRIVIIDDVLSDGATKLEAFKAIESTFNVAPVGILVSVNRSLAEDKPGLPNLPGISVRSIITLADIHDYLIEIGDPNARLVRDFMEARI